MSFSQGNKKKRINIRRKIPKHSSNKNNIRSIENSIENSIINNTKKRLTSRYKLRTRQNEQGTLNNNMKIKIGEFNQNTLPISTFQIEDVIEDGACFYRALANQLNFRWIVNEPEPNQNIMEFDGDWISDQDWISNEMCDNRDEYLSNIYSHLEWGYDGDSQTETARFLQKEAVKWLNEHRYEQVDGLDYKVGEYVNTIHELKFYDTNDEIDIDEIMEEYSGRYQYFAGDQVQVIDMEGDIDDLQDRWGSPCEAYAISKTYDLPIKIYTLEYIEPISGEIKMAQIKNNRGQSSSRFKLHQYFGQEHIDTRPIINLLYREQGVGHYMSLYPN